MSTLWFYKNLNLLEPVNFRFSQENYIIWLKAASILKGINMKFPFISHQIHIFIFLF